MKEYKFLNFSRVLLKVLAWIVLVLGVLIGMIVLITGGGTMPPTVPGAPPVATPRAAGVVFIIMGGLYFVFLYTASEIIGLLLDLKKSCIKSV